MASKVLVFGVTLAILVTVSVSAPVIRCISCPCGSSSQNYTHCIDESLLEERTCEWWLHCGTCEGNTTACKTCPPDRFGPSCSKNPPVDEPQMCSAPSLSPEFQVVESLVDLKKSTPVFDPGTELNIKCKKRYSWRKGGKKKIRCNKHGRWDIPPSKCIYKPLPNAWDMRRKRCYNPKQVANGSMEVIRPYYDPNEPRGDDVEDLPLGTQLKYRCNEGYVLNGDDILICSANGYWSGDIPHCISDKDIKKCAYPELNPNVEVEEILNPDELIKPTFEPGAELTFKCRDGYVLEGAQRIECFARGVWSDLSPTCNPEEGISSPIDEPPMCPIPDLGPYVVVREFYFDYTKLKLFYDPGFELTIRCKKVSILEGQSTVRCNSSGHWSTPTARCVPKLKSNAVKFPPVFCYNPKHIPNGSVKSIGPYADPNHQYPEDDIEYFPLGTQLKYTCNEGFVLKGKTILTCTPFAYHGYWSGRKPNCIRA